MLSVKRTISIASAATLFMLLICIFTASNAYATQDLRLSMDNIDMDKDGDIVYLEKDDDCEEKIKSAKAQEESIAAIDNTDSDFVEVAAAGLGDTVIIVTGDKGSVIKVPVHVGEKGLRNALKYGSGASDLYYGDTIFTVETRAGNKVTVKIGKHTYTGIAKKGGEGNGYIDFKLKKMYNIKTKIKYTVEKDGVTYTHRATIWNGTNVIRASASGKTLKLTLSNCHKGDVLIVKYAGKKYTKRIKNNHSWKSWKCNIKVKKNISKKATMKILLKNKYKTNLGKYKVKMNKGRWVNNIWW